MHPFGKLLLRNSDHPPSSWLIALVFPLAVTIWYWLDLDGLQAVTSLLAPLVVPVVLLALWRAHTGPKSLTQEGALLSWFLVVSSAAWCLAGALWIWLTLNCSCPGEVFTPGRGWHYSEGCGCGQEVIWIAIWFFGALSAAFAIPLSCWLLSLLGLDRGSS